jgi:hypothetical protein
VLGMRIDTSKQHARMRKRLVVLWLVCEYGGCVIVHATPRWCASENARICA